MGLKKHTHKHDRQSRRRMFFSLCVLLCAIVACRANDAPLSERWRFGEWQSMDGATAASATNATLTCFGDGALHQGAGVAAGGEGGLLGGAHGRGGQQGRGAPVLRIGGRIAPRADLAAGLGMALHGDSLSLHLCPRLGQTALISGAFVRFPGLPGSAAPAPIASRRPMRLACGLHEQLARRAGRPARPAQRTTREPGGP